MIKRKKIAVALTSIHQKAVHHTLTALGNEAAKRGYDVQIFATFSDLFHRSESDLAQRQVFELIPYDEISGLIIFGETIKDNETKAMLSEQIKKYNIPAISFKQPVDGCVNISYDSEAALANIIRHLIEEHNCRTLNFISGLKGNPIAEARTQIFKDVLAEYGIEADENRIAYGDFWDKPARQAMRNFLDSGMPLPDAVVCANDAMGIAVCDLLKKKNIRIPEDIIVTGLGGIEEREYRLPLLTTSIYDPKQTAVHIMDTLQQLEQHGSDCKISDKIHCRLDFAESCGCQHEHQKIYERQLLSTYNQMARERRFSHNTHDFMDTINQECTINTLSTKLHEYLWGPRISSCNFFLDAHFATNYSIKKVPSTERRFMWIPPFANNNELQKILPYSEYAEFNNHLFGASRQMMIIPLDAGGELCGLLCINYPGETLDHECLYELIMTLNNILNGLHNRAEYLKISHELNEISEQTIQSLAEIVEAKSEFTGLHVKRVSEYTRVLAEAMGYSSQKVDMLRIASMLHDIGKINTPSEILEKPGRLTPEEFNVIKRHVADGYKMLCRAPGEIMELACKIAQQHHEKWNGTGYLGIKGEDISLDARIVALADVYDALVSKRPYKRPFSSQEAYDIIVNDSGIHFDPKVVEAFKNNFDRFIQISDSYNDEKVLVY